MGNPLQVKNISAGYGKLQILSDVSMEARPGQITVIVGPNGSGKSTMLKTIAGLATIYQGEITLDGKKISGLPPHDIARLGVVYLPQTESTFTELKVMENFKMAGYTVRRGEFESRLKDALEIFPQLKQYLQSKVSSLSGGERQMVTMTMALIRKPEVIMFDEPTANLAPKIAAQVLATISSLVENTGLVVMLIEQNARKALEIGDTAYLFVSGKPVFHGSCKELLEHKELGRLYLGLRAA